MAAKEQGKGTRRRTPPSPADTPSPTTSQDDQVSPRRRTARRPEGEAEATPATTQGGAATPAGTSEATSSATGTGARTRRRRATPGGETPPTTTQAPPETPAEARVPATAGPDVTVEASSQGLEEPAASAAAAAVEAAAAAAQEDEMAGGEALEEAAMEEAAGDLELAAEEADETGAADRALGVVGANGTGAAQPERPRRERHRTTHSNALGALIERQFADPASPCRSYSDLERHSGISREALSRYVTARPDRRRSPTIDTLVAIADAMHLSLESVARAAAASVKGVMPPPEEEQHARQEVLGTLVAALTPEQFGAVVELLRQLRPVPQAS